MRALKSFLKFNFVLALLASIVASVIATVKHSRSTSAPGETATGEFPSVPENPAA